MDLLEAIQARHAVRKYLDKKIDAETVSRLQQAIDTFNAEQGLNIQLCLEAPEAFDSFLARYGSFSNVRNYIALVGKKDDECLQLCGYYGEKLVLLAQQLGLNTCWVGGTYSKRKAVAKMGMREKLHLVIALGYGETQGTPHRMKPLEEISFVPEGPMPEWFRAAMEAVQLAPTAMNQQRFLFTLKGNAVIAKAHGGFYTQVDLGIAKCHFEIGAEAAGATENDWHWA